MVITRQEVCYFCEENKLCNDSWDDDTFVCEKCFNEKNLGCEDKE